MKTIDLESAGTITPHDDVREAVDIWHRVRGLHGLGKDNGDALLTAPSVQPKVGKNERPTASLTLTAGSVDGLCVNDGPCFDSCVVNQSARAQYQTVIRARLARTMFLTDYPAHYLALVMHRLTVWHDRKGIMDLRPNANSDVAWERIAPALFDLLASWDGVAYDYTKRRDRVGHLLPNYRTTYSVTRSTRPETIATILGKGDTVTAVFAGRVPTEWRGFPVVDGDVTDDRYRDPAGVVVGLTAKGKLRGKVDHPLLVSA